MARSLRDYRHVYGSLPIDQAWKHRMIEEPETESYAYQRLRDSIAQYGFDRPVILEYNPVNREAIVVSGDEQIAVVKELRRKELPASVLLSCHELTTYGREPRKVVGAKVKARSYTECLALQAKKAVYRPSEIFPVGRRRA